MKYISSFVQAASRASSQELIMCALRSNRTSRESLSVSSSQLPISSEYSLQRAYRSQDCCMLESLARQTSTRAPLLEPSIPMQGRAHTFSFSSFSSRSLWP